MLSRALFARRLLVRRSVVRPYTPFITPMRYYSSPTKGNLPQSLPPSTRPSLRPEGGPSAEAPAAPSTGAPAFSGPDPPARAPSASSVETSTSPGWEPSAQVPPAPSAEFSTSSSSDSHAEAPGTPSAEASKSSSLDSAASPPPPTPPLPPLDDLLASAPEPSNQDPHSSPFPRSKDRSADSLPKSAYISSTDRRRSKVFRYSGYTAIAGLLLTVLYFGRPLNEEESKAHPTLTPSLTDFYARLVARKNDFLAFYNEPPFDKLLPDPVADYSRPYTLVISLEDLMVHSSWSREHGWRIAKRPGLDYFLAYLFQYYEIVVFTSQPDPIAGPIIQKIDQSPGYIMYMLFRPHTRYVNGKYIKDLNFLNRDLSKVVMLETNPDAWSANPDNTIKLKPWKGETGDRELVSLIPFLEYLAALEVKDVRKVIKDYDGTHIPTEFARREEVLREELRKQLGASGAKKKGPPNWLLALLGVKPKDDAEEEDVKTFMDMARERGLQNYLAMQRHVEVNKDELEREQKQMEKEMQEQMRTSLTKIFTEGFPGQPKQQ